MSWCSEKSQRQLSYHKNKQTNVAPSILLCKIIIALFFVADDFSLSYMYQIYARLGKQSYLPDVKLPADILQLLHVIVDC